MDKNKKDKISLVIVFLLTGTLLGVYWGAYLSRNDYRQGQIDALTGKIKYELKANPDSTITWYEKESK